ncbi:unnamed protein product, partial [Brachionus calyciflorus]
MRKPDKEISNFCQEVLEDIWAENRK